MDAPPVKAGFVSAKYGRREFGKMVLAGALGTNSVSKLDEVRAEGNKWSATGLRLGVSHQRLENLNASQFGYLKQMGVEYLEVRIPSAHSTLPNLMGIRRQVEKAGLKVFEIMLIDKYTTREVALGLPGRDREIAYFQNFLRDLGKAGIDCTTYAWHTRGIAATGRASTRGFNTRAFDARQARLAPNAYDREFAEEELWDNYQYFIRRVLPVAEDAGVRLQLHPNDPPVNHQGVPRIFRSTAAFRRAMEISNHSPFSGILFCAGTWAEMSGPEGKGEDLVQAIHELGARGHIFQVHLRNVSAPLPVFHETFPDNGYVNLYRVMKALGEVNFNGMVVPDHVPRFVDGAGGPKAGEAYIFGYIKALIQAVDTERGRMA